MKIHKFSFDGFKYYDIDVDESYSKGILHFSHEIEITLDESLNFVTASEIASEFMSYAACEEDVFEYEHPHLLEKIRKKIMEDKI